MDGTKFWIVAGRVDDDPFRNEETNTPETLLQRGGGIHVTTGSEGTVISWAMFSPNWASLYYVSEAVFGYPPPYTLEFYLAGWFSQKIEDASTASERLQDLITKGDVHLRQKTFVKTMDPECGIFIPDSLQEAWTDKHVPAERSLECVYDESSGRFYVERIGRDSTIAKMWGTSPTTYPCLSGHSYDQIVSQAYKQVMTTGERHYDHVLASMMTNTKKAVWIPYQRVIVPHIFPDGRKGVAVMSEVAEVDIRPL